MNKTKIIATVGPVSSNKDIIKKLITAGVDVIRINMKHATREFCDEIIKSVNDLNKSLKTHIGIMADLKGPTITVGKMQNESAFFKKGDKIRIYTDDVIGDSTKFSVSYANILEDVRYDSIIKIGSGEVTLKVLDKGKNYLLCEVLKEGVVTENKTISVPGVKLNLPFLSQKDIDDIKYASKNGIDYIGLSYVQSVENVLDVNDMLIGLGNDHISIIAKIENEWALNEIDEIIKSCEGVMIARGDLGVELPLERIPGIQKMIINKCHKYGRISIVATDLLQSMSSSLEPTRAEVGDIAGAVLDGVDAVLLSDETTIGLYPVETIKTMEKIISAAECDVDYDTLLSKAIKNEDNDITCMIAYNVVESANRLKCKSIIAPTVSGYTARKISRFRPSCPIIAPTPDADTAKLLSLQYGVIPVLVDELKTFDKIVEHARKLTKEMLPMEKGDYYIITGGYPFKEVKHTNFMKIEEI
ncbi:MAG: pyruvate kinase [Bacillales bacterium]|nr:pyruvate kinase [Bacillales bacterium]